MIRHIPIVSLRFAAILLTTVLAGPSYATAAAAVCAGNPAEIQAGLTAAGSNGGTNEIRIKSGAYTLSNVLFFAPNSNGSLSVSGGWNTDCSASSEDRAATILDSGGTSQVFAVNAGTAIADVSLSSLTIQNGSTTGAPGACVFIRTGGDFSATNTRLTGCRVSNGYYGAAFWIEKAGQVDIADTLIDYNEAPSGAGIGVKEASMLTIVRTDFLSNMNSSPNVGSALKIGNFSRPIGAIRISHSTFSSNLGSPLSINTPASVDIESSQFTNNTNVSSAVNEECGFVDNIGTPTMPGRISILGSSFQASGAASQSCLRLTINGGSTQEFAGTASIRDTTFNGFTHGVLSKFGRAGGYVDCELSGDTFVNNSGYSAVESWCPNLHISRSRFISNSAVGSYPAAVLADSFISVVAIDNSLFERNSTPGSGGAIAINHRCDGGCFNDAEATVTLTNNTFVSNSAGTNGGAVSMVSIYDTSPTFQLWNNLFWQNSAGGQGSDIYFDNDADGDFLLTPITLNNNAYSLMGGLYIKVPQTPIGGGNINATDPMFVSPITGDYRLTAASPMIDFGTAAAPSIGALDAAGMPRAVGLEPDIGAYEFNADLIFRNGFEFF